MPRRSPGRKRWRRFWHARMTWREETEGIQLHRVNVGWEVDVDVGAGVYVEVGVGNDMVDVVVLAVVGDAVGLRRLA